jgi:hypothetical protein
LELLSKRQTKALAGWICWLRVGIGGRDEGGWLLNESKELLAILGASQKTAKENRQQTS